VIERFDLIRSRFTRLERSHRIAVLVAASFNLTIESRGLREVTDVTARTLATGLNEVQHKFLSQALAELSGTTSYPDDVLMDIICEVAQKVGVLDATVASLEDALDKYER
jgi:hypothetical protein